MEIALFISISVLKIVAFIAWDNKKRRQKLEKAFSGSSARTVDYGFRVVREIE